MQTLWSRAAPTRCICKCAFCRSTTALSRTSTSSALKRRIRFKDVFTVFYSTVLTSAAVVDSHRKDVRRKEWKVAIQEAKDEIAAIEDQHRIRLLSLSQRLGEDENTKSAPLPPALTRDGNTLSYIRTAENTWEAVFAKAARDTQEREILGFQDLLGFPLSTLRDLSSDEIEELLRDPDIFRLNTRGDFQRKLWAPRRRTHPWTVKKVKTLEWSVRKLAYRLLLSCEEKGPQEQSAENDDEVPEVRLNQTTRQAISAKINRCQRSLDFIMNNPEEPSLWTTLRSPSIPSYQAEATNDTDPTFGEILGLFRSYQDGALGVNALICNLCNLLLATREPPDVSSFNALIVGLSRLKRHENVQFVIESMLECCIRPNAITLSAVLHHYAITHDKKRFNVIIKKMDGKLGGLWKENPSKSVAPGLRERYALRAWQPKEVVIKDEDRDLLVEDQGDALLFSRNDGTPHEGFPTQKTVGTARMGMKNRVVYCALIHSSLKLDQPSWAMRHYSDMVNEGFAPDFSVLKSIMVYCTKNQEWDAGVAVWKQLCGIAGAVSQVVFGLMLTLCRSCENLIEYGEILNRGVRAGLIESGSCIFPETIAAGLDDPSLDANDLVAFPRLPQLQIAINRDHLERAIELLAFQIAKTALDLASFDLDARKESVGFKIYLKTKRLYTDGLAAEAYRCRSVISHFVVDEAPIERSHIWEDALQSLREDENNEGEADRSRSIPSSDESTATQKTLSPLPNSEETLANGLGALETTSNVMTALNSACPHAENHDSADELSQEQEDPPRDQDNGPSESQCALCPLNENKEDAEAMDMEQRVRSHGLGTAQKIPDQLQAADKRLPKTQGTQNLLVQLIDHMSSSDDSVGHPYRVAEKPQSRPENQITQKGVTTSQLPRLQASSGAHLSKLFLQNSQMQTNYADLISQQFQDLETQFSQKQQSLQSSFVHEQSSPSQKDPSSNISPEALLQWDDAMESLRERDSHQGKQERSLRLSHDLVSIPMFTGASAGGFPGSRSVAVREQAQAPGITHNEIGSQHASSRSEHEGQADLHHWSSKPRETFNVDQLPDEETHNSARPGVSSRRVQLISIRRPLRAASSLGETSQQPTALAANRQLPTQDVQDRKVQKGNTRSELIDDYEHKKGSPYLDSSYHPIGGTPGGLYWLSIFGTSNPNARRFKKSESPATTPEDVLCFEESIGEGLPIGKPPTKKLSSAQRYQDNNGIRDEVSLGHLKRTATIPSPQIRYNEAKIIEHQSTKQAVPEIHRKDLPQVVGTATPTTPYQASRWHAWRKRRQDRKRIGKHAKHLVLKTDQPQEPLDLNGERSILTEQSNVAKNVIKAPSAEEEDQTKVRLLFPRDPTVLERSSPYVSVDLPPLVGEGTSTSPDNRRRWLRRQAKLEQLITAEGVSHGSEESTRLKHDERNAPEQSISKHDKPGSEDEDQYSTPAARNLGAEEAHPHMEAKWLQALRANRRRRITRESSGQALRMHDDSAFDVRAQDAPEKIQAAGTGG